MPSENVFGIKRFPRITDLNASQVEYVLPQFELVKMRTHADLHAGNFSGKTITAKKPST